MVVAAAGVLTTTTSINNSPRPDEAVEAAAAAAEVTAVREDTAWAEAEVTEAAAEVAAELRPHGRACMMTSLSPTPARVPGAFEAAPRALPIRNTHLRPTRLPDPRTPASRAPTTAAAAEEVAVASTPTPDKRGGHGNDNAAEFARVMEALAVYTSPPRSLQRTNGFAREG